MSEPELSIDEILAQINNEYGDRDWAKAKAALLEAIKGAKPNRKSDISGYHEDFTPDQLTRITVANRKHNIAIDNYEQNLIKLFGGK